MPFETLEKVQSSTLAFHVIKFVFPVYATEVVIAYCSTMTLYSLLSRSAGTLQLDINLMLVLFSSF